MTTRRCHGCAHFYDAALRECPECKTPRHQVNKWLRHAQMNSALLSQAQHAIETQ
jgi:rubredoxin